LQQVFVCNIFPPDIIHKNSVVFHFEVFL